MVDLLLDPITGDLDLSSNDLQLVTGVDAIVQQLTIRYRFFLGEWFLDTREGVPWYQRILIKNPGFSDVNAILRQVAVDTPHIAKVNRFDSSFDPTTRELTVALWAVSDEDEPVELNRPFIIGGPL